MIEGGIFTAPPRFEHSGAALLDGDGRLVGVGSLWVSDALEIGAAFPGNMFVPIDLLKPLLNDLLASGHRREPARPWLGVYSEEVQGHVVVTRVLPQSPAEQAGLARGDIILGVGGQAVGRQSEFYQRLWSSGDAGTPVVLHVLHKKSVRQLTVRSMDRMAFLRPWRS
jgi:S1-C subfamily serine protease